MITVWGRSDSSATARVMWAAGEAGVSVERRDWGGDFGGNDDPAFRTVSPPGRIPAITTSTGFSLWESAAIIRWLASRHPQAGLWPEDPQARWQAEAWMDWSAAPARAVGAVRTAYRRSSPDPAEMARSVAAAVDVLQVLETRLAGRAFVMGRQLSVADLALGVAVHRWFRVPPELEPPRLPALADWYARLCERPAFREHVLEKVSVRPQRVGG